MMFGFVAVLVPILPSPPCREVVLICPRCQSRIPVASKFCPECGADLRPKKRESASK
jgi:ribosomal protein L40E